MGMGKSSGSQTTQLTPEQTQALQAQTNFLTNTVFPAYQNTISGAQNVYNQVNPSANAAATNAINVASQTGQAQQGAGNYGLNAGTAGQGQMAAYQQGLGQAFTGAGANTLSQLFSPDYEKQQVQAALEPGYESALQAQAGQNAMYGGAGGLGSAREALADQNLQSLTGMRQSAAAAGAQSQVEQNRMAAANSILGAGMNANTAAQQGYAGLAGQGASNLNAANQAAAANIGYAQAPQSTYNQYASTIFGMPTSNTTPNFAGTQSTSSTGKGKNIGSSDARLKEDIDDLEYGLEHVMMMRPVRWNWKDMETYGDQPSIGFIAQELNEIIPDVVTVNDDDKLGIYYGQLVSVLVKAIQDQQLAIEFLEERIEALEA